MQKLPQFSPTMVLYLHNHVYNQVEKVDADGFDILFKLLVFGPKKRGQCWI